MRCRTNDYILDWEARPEDIMPFPQQAIHSNQVDVIGGIGGVTDEKRLSMERSCFAMGQSAGGIKSVQTVAEIVDDLIRDTEAALRKANAYLS